MRTRVDSPDTLTSQPQLRKASWLTPTTVLDLYIYIGKLEMTEHILSADGKWLWSDSEWIPAPPVHSKGATQGSTPANAHLAQSSPTGGAKRPWSEYSREEKRKWWLMWGGGLAALFIFLVVLDITGQLDDGKNKDTPECQAYDQMQAEIRQAANNGLSAGDIGYSFTEQQIIDHECEQS